jgi:hypothetical protein
MSFYQRLMVPHIFGVILVTTLFCSAVDAKTPSDIEIVESKEVSSSVISALQQHDNREVIIVFDESQLLTLGIVNTYGKRSDKIQIMSELNASNLPHEEKLIRKKALRQVGKKIILQKLNSDDYEKILDYDHLPLVFARLKSHNALSTLLAQIGVEGVYENVENIQPILSSSLPAIGQPIIPPKGWEGAGTTVAVLDTGIQVSNAAFGNCIGRIGASGCKIAIASGVNGIIDDYNSHGTNVSAIVLGVAPGARIASYNVFGTSSNANTSDILNGINWAIANKSLYKIVAVNMSLGVPNMGYLSICSGLGFDAAFSSLRSYGINPVVAAGNDGFNSGISWPACTSGATRVGAVSDGGVRAGFSNIANFLSLMAPGINVTAGGITMSGTSQATPHVSGAIASIIPKYPFDSVDQLLNRLKTSGRSVYWGSGSPSYNVRSINLSQFRSLYGDEMPDLFAFGSQIDVERNVWVESDFITPMGYQVAAPVTIDGGEYSINGTSYTFSPGQLLPGNSIKVRLRSSSQYATTTSLSINIGGQLSNFAVKTKPNFGAVNVILQLLNN